MSDKPSLYVVEKREVVILVVLFVLVTVLAFTMGVRYGESVGKKVAQEQSAAEAVHNGSEAQAVGGTLGAVPAHGEPAPHGEAEHGAAPAKDEHGNAAHDEHAEESKPETAAKDGGESDDVPPAKEAADKNSDESLLNALKEAGVEPPGGKTAGNAKLPAEVKSKASSQKEVKKIPSGTYVIQVGSHPTRSEAEAQARQLSAKKVKAEILAPVKDRQGEWHRVVVGSYKTKRDAEREANALKARRAIISFFVWRLP
ncbi:MAG: SPOR domain-containing protein [Bacteriovoracia bacterium]